jgi:calcineurin-like phosphoesterase family protein
MDFYTSDWHLGHVRIIDLCERPFKDVDHMNNQLIERANDTVTEKDRLIMLGDNVMGDWAKNVELLRRLRAKQIILLPGNHDKWANTYKNSVTRQVRYHAAVEAVDPRIIAHMDRTPHGWDHHLLGLTPVTLSHYPYVGDSHEGDRFKDLRPVDRGQHLVHGHVHNSWKVNDRQINVGVDVWDFAPVSGAVLSGIVLSHDTIVT